MRENVSHLRNLESLRITDSSDAGEGRGDTALRGKLKPIRKRVVSLPKILELDQTSYKMPLKKSKIGSNTV